MAAMALLGATIMTGPDWTPVNGKAVLISNGKITAVVDERSIPETCTVTRLDGLYLLPGLIDLHVHLTWDGGTDPVGRILRSRPELVAIEGAQRAAATLMAGVTTVRDVGGPTGVVLSIRDAIDSDAIAGCRVLAAGAALCMTGGHGRATGREADGIDGVRLAARELLRDGVDLLKVMATGGVHASGEDPNSVQYSVEEMNAAVVASHAVGKTVAAHAQGREGIRNALDAGVDSIEHGCDLDSTLAQQGADHGQVLVPTLVAFERYASVGVAGGLPEGPVIKGEMMYKMGRKAVAVAAAAGMKIGAGTDAGGRMKPHGCLADELDLLVEAGLSTSEVLSAATDVAAGLCGLPRVGRIADDHEADLIAVAKNPLEDISAVRHVEMVMRGGRVFKERGVALI